MERFNKRLEKLKEGLAPSNNDIMLFEVSLQAVGEELERVADALEEANRLKRSSGKETDERGT